MYRCRGEEEDTFQGNRGKLGVYRGNCQPQCQGGGGSGGNQSICQVGGNEEIPDKQEKGDVWRNRGYKIKDREEGCNFFSLKTSGNKKERLDNILNIRWMNKMGLGRRKTG